MKAEDLIKNNSLTNIEVVDGQSVVFTEIALTAINLAREEGANDLIRQASANGQKKYQQGVAFMQQKAIKAFKKACTCIGCNHCDDCDSVREFIQFLNS